MKDVAQKYQILAEDHKELKSCLTEAVPWLEMESDVSISWLKRLYRVI